MPDEDTGSQRAPDPLLPVRLLAGDRQLGGALSWSQPAALAAFPAASPFVGLAVPPEVLVTRQVLAEPSAGLQARTWAGLADGTPLVTAAPHGSGRVVLFHVTANADWSNLPLSGLFVDMLRRLVDLSAGVAGAPDDALLAPSETLDGFGSLVPAARRRHRHHPGGPRQSRRLPAPPARPLRPRKRAPRPQPRRRPAAAGRRARRPRRHPRHPGRHRARAPLGPRPAGRRGGAAGPGPAAVPAPARPAPGGAATAMLALAAFATLAAHPAQAADLPALATRLAYVVTGDPPSTASPAPA